MAHAEALDGRERGGPGGDVEHGQPTSSDDVPNGGVSERRHTAI